MSLLTKVWTKSGNSIQDSFNLFNYQYNWKTICIWLERSFWSVLRSFDVFSKINDIKKWNSQDLFETLNEFIDILMIFTFSLDILILFQNFWPHSCQDIVLQSTYFIHVTRFLVFCAINYWNFPIKKMLISMSSENKN